jgi:ribosomal protein L11 methyltransferase
VKKSSSNLYRLSITCSLEYAWNALEAEGIEILYGSEEDIQTELFVLLASPTSWTKYDWITACEPHTLPPIDWEAQWAAHGLNFHEGFICVDFPSLRREGLPLRLLPGSGFGDLSHPTTRLMLHLLAQYLSNHVVIDIGCGSGVLTLAAVAMGALFAYGIDIDEQALEHSRQNASLNHFETQCTFSSPADFTFQPSAPSILILMNMIRTEQLAAWSSLTSLHLQSADLLTSGIPKEEREIYLKQIAHWGWHLCHEKEELGWLAFHFVKP